MQHEFARLDRYMGIANSYMDTSTLMSCPIVRLAHKLFLLLACLNAMPAFAYEIDGTKWIGGRTAFYVDLDGESYSEISWSEAVLEALVEWSEKTVFDFSVVEEYRDPCLLDNLNSIDFTDDVCGSEYGENTLAVTLISYETQDLGPPAIVESDIVVNSARQFDIFSGALGSSKAGIFAADFRRVALHELGHAIGLGHEETKQAVMAPTLGDIDSLQEDDIAGINYLYTGLSRCEIKNLPYGLIDGALESGDCTVDQLTVGGSDESYIDLYEFNVSDGIADFNFSVEAGQLDAVLILATSDLRYLAVDTASAANCNSSLSKSLGPGTYLIMVNTYDQPIKTECGGTGRYSLTSQFESSNRPVLSGAVSLLGTEHGASFEGGIRANDAQSFRNFFQPTDSLDIEAQILVDPSHVGRPGFILVAAILSDQFLMLNEHGVFVETGFNPNPFVPHRLKVLESAEDIVIARDLVPAELGITDIEVNIVVGYGLDSDPGEVYYHSTPINLTIGSSESTDS